MRVYIPGLYWLRKTKKDSLHIVYEFQLLWWTSIVSYRDSKCWEVSHFCLTYNTLIVQINNIICHIFISSLLFLTFFCFSFHLFLGNLSFINNHINNICDLRSPSYAKYIWLKWNYLRFDSLVQTLLGTDELIDLKKGFDGFTIIFIRTL